MFVGYDADSLRSNEGERGHVMKGWTQPKLVVLGRATPEESVLEVCKNHEVAGQQASGYDYCSWNSQNTNNCRGVTGS